MKTPVTCGSMACCGVASGCSGGERSSCLALHRSRWERTVDKDDTHKEEVTREVTREPRRDGLLYLLGVGLQRRGVTEGGGRERKPQAMAHDHNRAHVA